MAEIGATCLMLSPLPRQTVAGRARPSLGQNPPGSSVLVLGVPGLVSVTTVAVMRLHG